MFLVDHVIHLADNQGVVNPVQVKRIVLTENTIYLLICRFYSHRGHYRVLSSIPYAIGPY